MTKLKSPGSKSAADSELIATIEEQSAELRLLRVQRGMQQSQKSAQEVLGISGGFNDIRDFRGRLAAAQRCKERCGTYG